ncbi:hypothetical protein BN3590_02300 [Clostridium sp. C105KSO15]|nr:hypothetical protein BN3590_02300 [Clostridium sp. C105KSO15]
MKQNTKDIEEILRIINNIDAEVDKFINAETFSADRLEWVMENLQRVVVYEGRIEVEMRLGAMFCIWFNSVQNETNYICH